MQPESTDFLRFRQCCRLDGSVERVSCGRRNGKPAAFFTPAFSTPLESPEELVDFREQTRLFVNLNPIERETWRKLLSAQSIASIAKEEGVSRAAIYARIQGNSRGQGGMIAKNFWVLLWWRLRQELFTTQNHA